MTSRRGNAVSLLRESARRRVDGEGGGVAETPAGHRVHSPDVARTIRTRCRSGGSLSFWVRTQEGGRAKRIVMGLR